MTFLLTLTLWCLLLAVCWPLALLLLVLAPVIWLVSLPLLLAGAALGALLSLVVALFYLPVRLVQRLARG